MKMVKTRNKVDIPTMIENILVKTKGEVKINISALCLVSIVQLDGTAIHICRTQLIDALIAAYRLIGGKL